MAGEESMTRAAQGPAPVPAAAVERLKAVVGGAGYLEDPADVAPFCASWRDAWDGRAPIVLRPQSTDEVAALLRICAELRVPIVPQGGNTGLTGAGQPHADMSEIIITTARLNRIRAVDALNDSMVVEAGVLLKDVQAAAARYDRLFPLSLGAEGSCHIGGNIATNAGGVHVLRYGTTRNLVLGLEVVLPDGRVWNGLRALRKDNTGYDMKQLFIGAEGTLGIITAAVLRLFPRPTASESAWIAVPSPQSAVALLGHMRTRLGDAVSAFELIGRGSIDLLLQGVPGHEDPMATVHPWYVLMDVTGQGPPGSLHEPLSEALASAYEGRLLGDALIAASGAQAQKLWRMREDLVAAQAAAGGSIAHDVSIPVSCIPTFLERADAALLAAYPGVRSCAFGHVGDGNMHYNPVCPLGWDGARFRGERVRINRLVHDIVAELGGAISAEHGIGQARLRELEHYKQPVELEMMRLMKRALDPHGIMNPGKVIRA
jgi:FAD/FMN-containing dehydrogenase